MRWIAIGVLTVSLAACASGSQPGRRDVAWTGGDPARLASDKAACAHEVDQIDVNNSATYSDPTYGATSAMAAAVGRDNPLTDQKANIRAAAMASCMTGKGWKAP